MVCEKDKKEKNLLFSLPFPASQVVLMLKNSPANAGEVRESWCIPVSEHPLEEGNGNPLQYSCLENPMARGAWWATVHGAAKSWI